MHSLQYLLLFAWLPWQAAALPASQDKAEAFRTLGAFPLAKSKFTFDHEPPVLSWIPQAELEDQFGDILSVPASGDHLIEARIGAGIIGPDDRSVIDSNSFPYSGIGRVVWSDGSYCTGALVADRVVLTASHCVPWGKSGISVIFQPDFFDKERFGSAKVIATNAVYQNPVDNFNSTPCGVENDFAVMRLDSGFASKVGGFFGAVQWTSSVANGLTHVGYPQDLAAGARQYQQKNIQTSVISSLKCDAVGPLSTTCDATQGHSGGPLFNPSTNMIVGVFSAGSSTNNVFASGTLTALVAWARSNWS